MITIYYTKDQKSFQIIRPAQSFNGDWQGLVDAITGSYRYNDKYYKFYSHYVVA